ncbi:dienelactone hydrolase family protein [Myxococcaceae bacterium GXIMD 01537]
MSDRRIEIHSRGAIVHAYKALPEAGHGPVLVLLSQIHDEPARVREVADLYAEEGYVVLVPEIVRCVRPASASPGFQEVVELHRRFDVEAGYLELLATLKVARALPEGDGGGVGVVGFGMGATLAALAAARSAVECAVAYGPVGLEGLLSREAGGGAPLVLHFGGRDEVVPAASVEAIRGAWGRRPGTEVYVYPSAGHDFTRPGTPGHHRLSEDLAHGRTLGVLRRVLGPHYDFAALWDQHCYYEFGTRDAEATMKTMVARPYVNNVPIMTGGLGYEDLHRFYADHFVRVNPRDLQILLVSRTLGANRLVDEFLASFTHDVEMDWMIPGVAPTGRYVEIPVIVAVTFRGDKLCSEHLYWDQASVLVQLGLLDRGGLPIAGVEAARKVLDASLPSNTLMRHWHEPAHDAKV